LQAPHRLERSGGDWREWPPRLPRPRKTGASNRRPQRRRLKAAGQPRKGADIWERRLGFPSHAASFRRRGSMLLQRGAGLAAGEDALARCEAPEAQPGASWVPRWNGAYLSASTWPGVSWCWPTPSLSYPASVQRPRTAPLTAGL